MGVCIGTTENACVCQDLLAGLIDQGLKFHNGLFTIIDGLKVPWGAFKIVFGHHVLVQCCQVHKMHNILDCLPNYKLTWVKKR